MSGWGQTSDIYKTCIVSASIKVQVEGNNRVVNGSKCTQTTKDPIGIH